MTMLDKKSEALREMLDSSRRAVVFTGAGISTESGVPDFRSPGGFWTKYKPIDFSDYMASEELRRESWRRKIIGDKEWGSAEPNRGHRAIARLVNHGTVSSVITQNIDGLHQKSGVAEERIIELHGNGTYAVCLDCRRRFDLEPIIAAFQEREQLPVCDSCGGIVKTGTISFGQPMPLDAMIRAQKESEECDLFIAIGSSLVVYPAASFPVLAKRNGARLVILNRDPTDMDGIADLVLNQEIGPTLGAITGVD